MAERRKGSASRGAKAGSAKRGGRSSGQKGQAGAAPGGRGGAQARRSQGGSGQRLPGWAWLLIGAVLGGLLFFLVQALGGSGPSSSPDPEAEPSSAAEPERSSAASRQEAEEERDYDFYELLMNNEVTVPEAQRQSRREERQPAEGGDSTGSEESPEEPQERKAEDRPEFGDGQAYLLQAGSFRRQEAADQMRANLALAGLRAEIRTVELDNGERWYRVRVGPFTERERLEQARARMESRDIQPMLLRRKG